MMFGYVNINKPEIKFKHFEEYRSCYCGLCRELRDRYGIKGQISLSYDMTFVDMLLDGVYEPKSYTGTSHCILHPVTKVPVHKTDITSYCADMNILLTYFKCMDDWNDEKKVTRRMYAGLLSKAEKEISLRYPHKAQTIEKYLDKLSEYERAGQENLDTVSGCFGKIMEEIFAFKEDMWETELRRIGFFLGKFIYLLDAYDDLEEDEEKGNYNIFLKHSKEEGFDEKVKQLLIMMMSEACSSFERLPVLRHADVLRNILYSGVWCRYSEVLSGRRRQKDKDERK